MSALRGAAAASRNPCSACTNAPSLPRTARNPGHWEGDVIVGPQHRSAIGTLVERHTRYVKLIHLPRPDSFQLRDGLLRELAGLPACYCSRSPGIKAARWRGIWTSPRPLVPRSTSVMLAVHGSVERTRTRMDFCASTFRKARIYLGIAVAISRGSSANPIIARERSSMTVVPPKSSPSC